MSDYKVLIIGDGGVGKSTYVRKINTGKFKTKYDTTIGLEPHQLTLYTNKGEKEITVYDTAGQEKFGNVRSNIYKESDGAFIMFDLTSRITYMNIMKWHRDITNEMGDDFPVVIIGNKLDLERKVKPKLIKFPQKKKIPYFEMSVKDEFQLDLPFNAMLQKLYKDHTIQCASE